MSDLRTAAQQALEALEHDNPSGRTATITALRAALAEQRLTEAQQEMERSIESLKAALAQEQAEPVCKCDLRTRLVGDGCEVCNPELAAELAQEQPEPVQEPVCRADGMPTSAEERHLRRLLALRAAMPHTYHDDGEAQGAEHGISIDFMREPVAHIDAKLRALNVARAIAKQAEPVQEPVAWSQPSALDWESHQSEKMLKVTRSRQDEYGFTQRLCTAPPKLVPLTEEEIALIDWESLKTKLDCVRAVERALEEKNRGR